MIPKEFELDHLIIKDLKTAYALNAKPTRIDCSNDPIEPDHELLKAIDMVLEYYMTVGEYQFWTAYKNQHFV